MYRAVIFDLDGTLVQTERLKAISYARAGVELSDGRLQAREIVEAFKQVVGRSRQEVATYLLQTFDLGPAATDKMSELGVDRPWQAYVRLRLDIYEAMIADPEVLRRNQWPHNVELLERARANECRTGLATMSHCAQASRVLAALRLSEHFDFVASRDDVEKPKPDPEIYLLVADELGVAPQECLVIEDSPAGVQAAQSGGMDVIAVTTPFTAGQFRETALVDSRWVVHDPDELPRVLDERFLEHQRRHDDSTHGG